ncbi:MAG TPA: deaminase, partial [Erwinia persicina]|nr:deaminase [Erwinia persicina]
MTNSDPQRRTFLSHGSKLLGACVLLGAGSPLALAAGNPSPVRQEKTLSTLSARHYYLNNVLLETGFDYQDGVAVATRTALYCLEINDGKIVALRASNQRPDASLPHADAGG